MTMKMIADDLVAMRRDSMVVLADSSCDAIGQCMADIALPELHELRAPENGLVMARGRIGGDGAPFNLGEATVTRAAVQLQSGEVGFGYVLGRDKAKARLIAICDALIQSPRRDVVLERVVAPLRHAMLQRRQQTAARSAATRVDFFTLVRGEG